MVKKIKDNYLIIQIFSFLHNISSLEISSAHSDRLIVTILQVLLAELYYEIDCTNCKLYVLI